jgi:hypothetical protein
MSAWPHGRQPLLGRQVWSLLVIGSLWCAGGQRSWDLVGWGQIKDIPDSNTPEYFGLLRTDYKFRGQDDYVQYTIDMRINPCYDSVRTGGYGENCCQFTNVHGCQDMPEIYAGPDLLIGYFQNAHIVSCRGTLFEQDPNCGTYIEVHRKFGDTTSVLSDVRIDSIPLPNGYQTTRIATFALCLGDHELWWVVRSRSGPFVQKVKGFKVLSPSCPTPVGQIEAQTSTRESDRY